MGVAVATLATGLNGAAGEPTNGNGTNVTGGASQKQKETGECSTCGEIGHLRKSSRLCKMREKKIFPKCGVEGHERASHKDCKYHKKKSQGP